MQSIRRPLNELKVLVTRPNQRAAGLCQMIEQAGGTALHFAAIEISEPADSRSRDHAREHIDEYALALFISPTAAEKTLDFISALPANISVGAIGSKTARMLESHGLQLDIRPDGHDSEALLAHPKLQAEQISGRKIVIFRGEGGRELLGETLRERGAEVFYADMYQRSPPQNAAQLNDFLQQTDIVTVSSNEGLQNLYDLASDKRELTRHILIAPGDRAFTLAQALGFERIIVAENATDEACMNALEYTATKMSTKK
jgi:uroporphyrinogen-III synthase